MVKTKRYIPLTIRVVADGDLFVALCEELNVGSQGATVDEALENAKEAIVAHLEALAELGTRDRVFREHGLTVVGSPGRRSLSTIIGPDEIIESYFAPLDVEPVPA